MMNKSTLPLLLAGLSIVFSACTGPAKRTGKNPKFRAMMIQKFDADGDGKLNDAERQEARAAMQDRMLDRFDADGDGVLSEEERATMKSEFSNRKRGSRY